MEADGREKVENWAARQEEMEMERDRTDPSRWNAAALRDVSMERLTELNACQQKRKLTLSVGHWQMEYKLASAKKALWV